VKIASDLPGSAEPSPTHPRTTPMPTRPCPSSGIGPPSYAGRQIELAFAKSMTTTAGYRG
jgi:hypothetical protein